MKIFQVKSVLFILFLMIIFQPAFSYSETIVVGVSAYPPYDMSDKTYVSGINIELFREIAKELNLEIKYSPAPWKRLLAMMKSGKIDIIGTASKNSEREKFMNYLEPPYMYGKKVFYLNKKEKVIIDKFTDLHNLKVGLIRGSKHYDKFDKDNKLIRKEVSNEKLYMRMLAANRIDTFIGTETIMDFLIQKNGFAGKFSKAKYNYPGTPGFFCLSKKSKHANKLSKMNKILKKLIANGTVKKITKKYTTGKGTKKYKIK